VVIVVTISYDNGDGCGSHLLKFYLTYGLITLEEENSRWKTQNEKQLDTEAASANRLVTRVRNGVERINKSAIKRWGCSVEQHWIDMSNTLTTSFALHVRGFREGCP
jgi:hypothetical protein